jgi:hypothetical protein
MTRDHTHSCECDDGTYSSEIWKAEGATCASGHRQESADRLGKGRTKVTAGEWIRWNTTTTKTLAAVRIRLSTLMFAFSH